MAESNPNKINQYTPPDPRQALFLSLYLDSDSETFSNAFQSALAAGYETSYAETITSKMPRWLAEKVRSEKLVAQAEKNLDRFISEEPQDSVDKKIRADMTKFTLERLNRKKYAQKLEMDITESKFMGFTFVVPDAPELGVARSGAPQDPNFTS